VQFSYRVMAKRLGYEKALMERAPWADDDPNLYPEKLAAWEATQRELHALEPEEQGEEWIEQEEPAEIEPELPAPAETEPAVPETGESQEAEAAPEVIYGFHVHMPLVVQ
jgi:hypothetical protein